MATTTINGANRSRVHERVTTLTSSKGLTAATFVITGAEHGDYRQTYYPVEALVQVESGTVRWTKDGTVPTTTATTGIGFIAAPGDYLLLQGHDQIAAFRAINEVASNGAVLQASYAYVS